MADSAEHSDDAHRAARRDFDADLWGASPRWDAGHSVYDDGELDEEPVPRARSVLSADASSD